jgi:YHS domain-containing protein
MRFLILRILLPLLLFLIVRAVLRTIFASSNSPDAPQKRDDTVEAASPGGVLMKDPVCGTYVAASTGITRKAHGETLYFCSEECRNKYRAA